ncbi:hypothetical protein [Zhongshania sp.]|uniref:hypothetical protein n=1 Tax=Zhongshania sp. TaxID=1971902 RepID=UPI003568361C
MKIPLFGVIKRALYSVLLLLSAVVNASDGASLKVEALTVLSDLKLAKARSPSRMPAIALYIANSDKRFAIQSVRVSVNGRETARYSYSELEAQTLLDGGLHFLSKSALPKENNTISVKFAVVDVEAGPHAERLYPRFEKVISVAENTQWELELIRSGWLKWQDKVAIQVHDRGPEDRVSIGDSHPRFRSMYFNAKRHFSFDALADAMVMIKSGVSAVQFPEQVKLALSRSARDLGLTEVPASLQGLVEFDRLRDESKLGSMFSHFNTGAALIQQGKYVEGVALLAALSEGELLSPDELLLRDKVNLALGYHFLKQGDSEQSVNYFSQVRRLSPYANKGLVGLGWALLSPRQNQTAPLVVSDDHSAQALATATPYLWSGSKDEIAWARRHTPFRRAWAIASGGKEEDLQAAMVPWMELVNRDPLDPAVQEGLLILPYVMSHWAGQAQRAERYYVAASDRLQAALQGLRDASADIQRGGLRAAIDLADQRGRSGWDIWLSALYNDKDAYLDLLIDSPKFHEALSEYRQLVRIRDLLSADQSGALVAVDGGELDAKLTALLPRLTASIAMRAATLDREALAEIGRHHRRTEMYLAEANFALARSHENTRRKLSGVVWDGEMMR